MCQLKFPHFAGAVVLAAALSATPALAVPAPDAGAPEVGALQALADWWTELTEPVVGLFASSSDTADLDEPTMDTTSDEPDTGTRNRATWDPDG
ncbi:MAG: hypothetical protein ACOC7L_01225 [Acidobacteriota bacterium]